MEVFLPNSIISEVLPPHESQAPECMYEVFIGDIGSIRKLVRLTEE